MSSSRLSPVHRAAIGFFLLLFAATMWPVYPLFAGISPMVLGIPFSLFYQILLVAFSFSALLGLFLWEYHGGEKD